MSHDEYDDDFDLPPDDVPRFAYEEAEGVLDRFASRQGAEFQRAYMKLKGMAALYAYADFYDPDYSPALAVARGWEELQIAFTGRGEAFLSGAVLNLWNYCTTKKSEKGLERAVKKAFKAAEAATPPDAVRLYLSEHRNEPLRHPDEGFVLEPYLPCAGIRLREWALGQNLDADHVEEQFMWLEMADRGLDPDDDTDDTDDRTIAGRRPRLQVLDGGKTTQGTKKGK
jgi:hypothetical protein